MGALAVSFALRPNAGLTNTPCVNQIELRRCEASLARERLGEALA